MRVVEGILMAKEKISDDSYAVIVSTLNDGLQVYEVSREAGYVTTLASEGFLCEDDVAFEKKVGWGAKVAIDDYGKVIIFRAFGQPGYSGVDQIAKEEIYRQAMRNEGLLYRMFRQVSKIKPILVIEHLGLSRAPK